MSGQIFISYRRQESRWSARSLHDRLCRDFDPEQIFMDIDTIGLGEDFVEAIETTVAKCGVLIAVIGNNWLASKDDHGNRQLDNPEDFVRMEIGAALKRKIRVIPVLVDGALMPQSTDLPEDLKPLVRRNALLITETSFDGDCQRLATAIRQVLEQASAEELEHLATEQRQREEKQRLGAETRQKEGQERLEAEQREKERLKAEASESKGTIRSPSQNRELSQVETPTVVQSKGSTTRKPFARMTLFAALLVILVVGLIWFAIRGGREEAPVIPVPTGFTPTHTPAGTATPTPMPNRTGPESTPAATSTPTPESTPTRIGETSAAGAHNLNNAEKDHPWINSLGMKFVPAAGTEVLFSVWDTRVQDFEMFVKSTGYDPRVGMASYGKDGLKQRGATWKEPGFSQGPTNPVVGVSWDDAEEFCKWLTKRERSTGDLPQDREYRLATDAEWSAAVGLQYEVGSTPHEKSAKVELYPWDIPQKRDKSWPPPAGAGNYAGEEVRNGDWPSSLGCIESYNDGYPRTSPVGAFPANQFGLYDMGGNVWQWCEDWYDFDKQYRVWRGASWQSFHPDALLASYRRGVPPDTRTCLAGFRCVVASDSSR